MSTFTRNYHMFLFYDDFYFYLQLENTECYNRAGNGLNWAED